MNAPGIVNAVIIPYLLSPQIESIQKKDVQNMKMKSILSAKKKRGDLQSDDVTFFCRRCNLMACQLNQFRRLKDSYHVVLDKSFVDEKVQLKPRKKSKKIDDVLLETKVIFDQFFLTVKSHSAWLPTGGDTAPNVECFHTRHGYSHGYGADSAPNFECFYTRNGTDTVTARITRHGIFMFLYTALH